MKTIIMATEDLYNGGKCFSKYQTYVVKGDIQTEASLMEKETLNDQYQKHIIGSWWRNFKIVGHEN